MANTGNNMTNAQKKDLAKKLFLQYDLTQKQIAQNLGVNENTVGRWAKEQQWDVLKKSLVTSKDERLAELYQQLAYVNKRNKEAIEDNDDKTNPNYDDVAKISKVIERLEKDAGVGDMIQTVIAAINFVEKEDLEAAKTVSHWLYIFIQDKMQEVKQ